jgi:hypothetical protein
MSVGGSILYAVLALPVGLVVTAVFVVTYAELRGHEPSGTSTPTLLAEMTRP